MGKVAYMIKLPSERRMIKRNDVAVAQVLVQWSNTIPTDAIWEDWSDLHQKFPNFKP